jgi:hypothetical protein
VFNQLDIVNGTHSLCLQENNFAAVGFLTEENYSMIRNFEEVPSLDKGGGVMLGLVSQ